MTYLHINNTLQGIPSIALHEKVNNNIKIKIQTDSTKPTTKIAYSIHTILFTNIVFII